jgi:predicted transcriptional regulator
LKFLRNVGCDVRRARVVAAAAAAVEEEKEEDVGGEGCRASTRMKMMRRKWSYKMRKPSS